MPSLSRRRTPGLSRLLIAASLALSTLSACTAGKPDEIRACPPAVWPSDEALAGYAACPPNQAFEEWFDKDERLQCRLAGLKDCGR